MAYLDTADLVTRCNRLARVSSNASYPVAADWYDFLTQAENEIKTELASTLPNVIVAAPVLMTTPDNGATYVFGTDADNNELYPIGACQVFASLTDIPTNPFTPGVDYLMEGYRIRWLNNQTRTFTNGPYARFVPPTFTINASTEPTLPPMARLLLVYKAVAIYASSGGQQDPSPYLAMYEANKMSVWMALSTQFRGQGSVGALGGRQRLPFPIQYN
jgi:hypothetical protein